MSNTTPETPRAPEELMPEYNNAILEERHATHGPHKEVYDLVWNMWMPLLLSPKFMQLPGWTRVEMMMIQLKLARASNSPHVADHWKDVGGYAALNEMEATD